MVVGILSRVDCMIQSVDECMDQIVDDCILHSVSAGMAQPVEVFEIL